MNESTFDQFARSLSVARSRRGLLNAVGAGLGVLLAGSWRGTSSWFVAAQTTSDSGVTGTSYTSPTWGYSLSWDDNIWSSNPDEEYIGANDPAYGSEEMDQITLVAPDRLFLIAGYRGDSGDIVQCLNTNAQAFMDGEAVESVVPATSQGQPVEGTTPEGAAYRVYVMTTVTPVFTGASVENGLYLECRALRPGEAVFAAAFIAPQATFNETVSDAIDVLETFETGSGQGNGLINPHGADDTLPGLPPSEDESTAEPTMEAICPGINYDCQVSSDCCSGLFCQSPGGFCSDDPCKNEGAPCGGHTDCCYGLLCEVRDYSSRNPTPRCT